MPMNDGGPETNRLYVWLAKDLTGVEGIIAVPTDMGVLPLVTTDYKAALRYTPAAKAAARERRARAVLVEFLRGEEIMEAAP